MSPTPAPEQPVDPRAAALAGLASSNDTAYDDGPLSDAELVAATGAGITVGPDHAPAAVRQAIAEAGTGTPAESVTPAGDDRDVEDYDPAESPLAEETPAELLPADRDTALEALMGGIVTADERTVTLTGDVVDLGGDLERVVTVARYGAMLPAGFPMHAREGDVVLVTADEAARGESLSALAELPEGASAEEPSGEVTVDEDDEQLTDEALSAMGARQLIDYVNRHPDEAERVVELEQQRDKPRTTVLALTDTDR